MSEQSNPDRQVREIYGSTESAVALATKYGVSDVMIGLIRRGKSWKHITQKGAQSGSSNQ